MKIFLICGEKSGDNIVCKVLEKLKEELKDSYSEIEFAGIVFNETSEKYGIKQVFHPKELAVLGIGDIIFNLANILDKINDTANKVIDFQPDLIISVDAYDFCIRVVKKIRKIEKQKDKRQSQIWHIVAPSVWAYWSFRAKVLARYYDRLFYLLPFETKYFKPFETIRRKDGRGFLSTFIGYPATFQERDGSIMKDSNLIGITLGSRKNEIYRHYDLIIATIIRLKMFNSNLNFAFLVTKETVEMIKQIFKDFKNLTFIVDDEEKRQTIQKCALVIAKSGTNNIEIGALGTPMVVYYKTSWLTYLFAKIFAKIKFINLFNITLNKQIVPEFVQKHATADNLAGTVVYLLTNNGLRIQQVDQINKAISLMQRQDKIYPTDIVVEEIEKRIAR